MASSPAGAARHVALWRRWMTQADATGRQSGAAVIAAAVRSWIVHGEGLIRLRTRRATDGLAVPLQLQLLDPEQIDASRDGVIDGRLVVQGVAFDAIGRVVGYYLIRDPERLRLEVDFVPADEILHLYRPTRPGQARGVSELHAVIADARDLEDVMTALRRKAMIEACQALVIKTADQASPLADAKATRDGKALELAPGAVLQLKPGQEASGFNPTQSTGTESFIRALAYRVAAGLGVPYHVMTGDVSQANYSSARAALNTWRDRLAADQWTLLVPMLFDPLARAFERAAELGGTRLATPTERDWMFPPIRMLDPAKELAGLELALRLGVMTWPQAVAEAGYQAEPHIAEIEAWRARLAAAGVDFSARGAAPPTPAAPPAQE